MLPIGDENDHAGIAFVTITLIVLNVIAFLNEENRVSRRSCTAVACDGATRTAAVSPRWNIGRDVGCSRT